MASSEKEKLPRALHEPPTPINELQVVLASTSPSRLSILRSAGVEPVVVASGVDEDAVIRELEQAVGAASPTQVVSALAQAKAQAVIEELGQVRSQNAVQIGNEKPLFRDGLNLRQPAILIGGDSMLLIDGELQGKPHTAEETVKRWRNQRGKTAELLTGHAVYHRTGLGANESMGVLSQPAWSQEPYVEVSTTRIAFAEASDADIEAYAETGESFGCAGAFTLEALGGWFIDRIEGDPSSVIGLSLPVVRRALTHFGYPASATWNRV